MEDKGLMSVTKEELKQQLSVLTARRDRMQKNLYEVEKEIAEVNKKLAKMK
jgi:chromosome condensin MukBEF ATPase and DNA-binding subunit MukB